MNTSTFQFAAVALICMLPFMWQQVKLHQLLQKRSCVKDCQARRGDDWLSRHVGSEWVYWEVRSFLSISSWKSQPVSLQRCGVQMAWAPSWCHPGIQLKEKVPPTVLHLGRCPGTSNEKGLGSKRGRYDALQRAMQTNTGHFVSDQYSAWRESHQSQRSQRAAEKTDCSSSSSVQNCDFRAFSYKQQRSEGESGEGSASFWRPIPTIRE